MLKMLKEWACSIVFAMAAALFINIFLLQQIVVEGRSMEPTLHNKEHLFVSKVGHTFKKMPEYGDIVVLDSRVGRERNLRDDLIEPVNNWIGRPSHIYIKRVVGQPGDVMKISGGKVYRNGTVLTEEYLKEPMSLLQEVETTVPKEHVFVLGDNRNNSSDSRVLGSIPLDHVTGVMVFKL